MARVLKEGGRKPLIEASAALMAGSKFDGEMFYRIEAIAPHDSDERDISILISEDEMLRVISEWLAIHHRRRRSQRT